MAMGPSGNRRPRQISRMDRSSTRGHRSVPTLRGPPAAGWSPSTRGHGMLIRHRGTYGELVEAGRGDEGERWVTSGHIATRPATRPGTWSATRPVVWPAPRQAIRPAISSPTWSSSSPTSRPWPGRRRRSSAMVESGTVRLLDLVVISRSRDGEVEVRELGATAELASLAAVTGELGGLLTEHDIELVSLALPPGHDRVGAGHRGSLGSPAVGRRPTGRWPDPGRGAHPGGADRGGAVRAGRRQHG